MPATRDLLDWERAEFEETSPLQPGLLGRQTQNVSGVCRYCCSLAGGLVVGRNVRGRRGGKPTFTPVSRRSCGSSDLESGGRCGGAGTSAPRSGAVHPLSHTSSGPAPTGCSSACALTTA